jgi:F-type H+-transporting ATPase subunit c
MFLVTGLLMAQGHDDGGGSAEATKEFFTGPIAMALAAGLCGLAQGKAVSSACEGIARNPAAAGNIRTTLIIGLALIESLALYTLASLFF